MKHTRRHFAGLLQTGIAIAATGLQPVFLTAEPWTMGSGLLNRQRFEPLVGSAFRAVSPGGEALSLRLLAVEDLTNEAPQTPPIECSLLRFATGGASLPEGTYRMSHVNAGNFHLRLTPSGRGYSLAYLSFMAPEHLALLSIPRKPVILPKLPSRSVTTVA